MFEDRYKEEIDIIKPSEQALAKTLNSMNNANKAKNAKARRFTPKIAVACVLSFAIIFSVCLTVLNFNNSDSRLVGIYQAQNEDDVIDALNKGIHYTYSDENAIKLESNAIDITDAKLESLGPSNIDSSKNNDFSDTNNQVASVQEADIVKTDGEYIYYFNNTAKRLIIIHTNEGKTSLASSLYLPQCNASEMLIVDETICIITRKKQSVESIYINISDKTWPKIERTLSQDGAYITSRCVNGSILVISNYANSEEKLPQINEKKISYDCCWIAESPCYNSMTIATLYNVKEAKSDFDSVISVLGASNIIYVSETSIYLTGNRSNERTSLGYLTQTNIFRISIDNANLEMKASCTLNGVLNNQFSLDEKDGVLRVAAYFCEYSIKGKRILEANRVYCFDSDLELLGSSEKIGINESIKSVRFIGDTAYVVTFKQTDPLYAIDLSDPEDPIVLSELKITGFSTHLQPYGENLLLGIGYEANESGATNGIKLSLFDVSNKNNIDVVASKVYNWSKGYYSSAAIYNHKALLASPAKNIIGIPLYSSVNNKMDYIFFEYDGNSFVTKATVVVGIDANPETVRGLYIGDYAYVVSDYGVTSISLIDCLTVSELLFEN